MNTETQRREDAKAQEMPPLEEIPNESLLFHAAANTDNAFQLLKAGWDQKFLSPQEAGAIKLSLTKALMAVAELERRAIENSE